MATLPKSNKSKPEEPIEDPFAIISEYSSLPPADDPPVVTVDEEEEEELYFTSDLGEQVYPVAKDPKKYYPGIDVGFNQPPIYASPEEQARWSPEMSDLYNQMLAEESNEPMEKTGESPSVYPYEFMRPDQDIHQPEYGPDGQLPPGLTQKDLEEPIGEDPFSKIARYRKERDYWNQPFIPAIVGIAKEINNWDTGIKVAKIMNGAIADTVDWPYDVTMGFMNAALTKSGLDEYVGTFKVNNFRNFLHGLGYTFDEKTEGQIKIDEPTLYHIAEFMGMSIALLPIQTLVALKNAGAITQSFINQSASKLAKREYLGKEVNLPRLATDIVSKLPFLKPLKGSTLRSNFDAFKSGLGELGQTTVRHPFKTPYLETTGSAGAGMFYGMSRDEDSVFYSDSPTVQLLYSIAGGVLFTSHLTTLKLAGDLTNSAIQKLGSTFGSGAQRRASNRLLSLTPKDREQFGADSAENMDSILRAILDKDTKINLTPAEKEQYDIVTKYIDPDVLDIMTPAQKAAVVGRDEYLPLEKLITEVHPDLSPALQAELKELQNIMLKSFTFPGSAKIAELGYTREIFELQQKYLESLAIKRWEIAKDRAMSSIKAASPKLDEVHIATTIRNRVEKSLDDMGVQEDAVWAAATMDKQVSPDSAIDVWKGLLKDRDVAIADPEDLLLTGGNKDVLLKMFGFYDENNNWVPGAFHSEVWPGTVSIKRLQAIRSRVLKEVREQRKKGNHDKKRLMNAVQKAILDIFTQEARLIRMEKTETGEFAANVDSQLGSILTAIEHSAMLNKRFNDDIVGELLGPSATAKQKVDPTLTAEFIFSGSALKQASRVKKILEAVKLESPLVDKKTSKPPILPKTAGMGEDEAIAQPVTEALEAFLKLQFYRKFVSEIPIPDSSNKELVISNPVKAQEWVDAGREIFKLLSPELKKVLREAIITNEPGLLFGPHSKGLPTDHMKRINKYLWNKDRQITVLFSQVDPEDIFNWTAKGSKLIQNTPVTNTKKIRQVMQRLAISAQKDSTGRATRGLQEFVFNWIIEKSYLKTTDKLLGTETNTFSGAKMSALLEEPKTQIIVDTFLTKQQKEKLKVLEVTANMVDSFRVASPLRDKIGGLQTISGDTTGSFLIKVGKVLGAWLGRKTGTGTLQAPTEAGKMGMIISQKMQIDWAERFLIHALMDDNSKNLAILLQKTDTPAKAKEFDRYLRSFFAYTITEYNLPFPNIDQFGTIEGEEDEEDVEELIEKDPFSIISR